MWLRHTVATAPAGVGGPSVSGGIGGQSDHGNSAKWLAFGGLERTGETHK